MPEIFSQHSRLKLNEPGNQILSWTWKHPVTEKNLEIIAGYDASDRFFSSGSYLMFPWVNRHTAHTIQLGEEFISLTELGTKDSKGYPSHGLAYSWRRRILDHTDHSLLLELIPDESIALTPLSKIRVREEYSLHTISDEEVLTLRTFFQNENTAPFRFCYGYHPYFRMNSKQPPTQLRSNIKKQIPLQEDLIPVYPIYGIETDVFELEQIPILDSLFFGGEPNVLLQVQSESYQVSIHSYANASNEIPLSYVQIYTDFPGNRIAIEPMSAPGNAVLHGFSLTTLLPEEEKSGCFQILLSTM
ncbi:aldose epimerase [Leptospira tipperaryensis]|uniref:Aldose epimerase n=1 Tax=Leptospira tipperaryensis TaxID=2564040 RepID=A0A1D7V2E1_9LEPT|nr:aldose 1-epimerase [Leptospira tipperaryensis]AOP36008.1 aldose epimerase [Leptospira tipperaryensis]